MKYIDVILPLPLAATYTYVLPDGMCEDAQPGCRVIVPFGNKKIYTGIITRVSNTAPADLTFKHVLERPDAQPILLPVQMQLWQWVADYYMCPAGEVFKAAIPSGMKLESESRVVADDDFEAETKLTENEQKLLDCLTAGKEKSVQQLQRETGISQILRTVNSLLAKGAIHVKEEVKRSYKPKTKLLVELAGTYFSEEALNRLFNELKRAPKQVALLTKYIELAELPAALHLQNRQLLKEVERKTLLEASGSGAAILSTLTSRGVLQSVRREETRLPKENIHHVLGLSPLSGAQEKALKDISTSFHSHNVTLLHGVTSSGKTEVYIHLISQIIGKGKQVLYLVPEIALTTQLTERLYKVFGDRMGVYHSKFSDAERVEIWQKQLSEKPYEVILGVRSSVFLPFRNLGLVIVDEEHEQSYKQQEPAPRYHARNTAIVLAQMCGAKTLLGTATPSIETYYNAGNGKYGLVELKERFGQVLLPQIEVEDIKELQRKRRMTGLFSPHLLSEIRQALENRKQVILFQNRRGYAPVTECHTCGWVPKCPNCDVSLTFHKGLNQLTCHYCGFVSPFPARCPACNGTELTDKGFGTEKIEDELRLLFPEARIARMDLDTTRSRSSYEQLIGNFQNGRTDILVGTQMVTKGLDFENVSVVGILNADTMLNQPDFRSYEKAFQMMTQVAGRAGRRQAQGLVVLQTKSPDAPVIRNVVEHNYRELYEEQLAEREMFEFPPFVRLIYIYMKHRDNHVLDQLATTLGNQLRKVFGTAVLGPDIPPIARMQALYIRKIVLKIKPQTDLAKVRSYLLSLKKEITAYTAFHAAVIYFDADPL